MFSLDAWASKISCMPSVLGGLIIIDQRAQLCLAILAASAGSTAVP